MKKIAVPAVFCLLSVLVSFQAHATTKDQLYGGWDCAAEINESGVKMIINSKANYVRNGTINSMGSMKVRLSPELPEMLYSFTTSGVWSLDDPYLITTYKHVNVKNISHPDFDKVFNMKDFIPENASESTKITSFSPSNITMLSESNGQSYQCSRTL